MQSKKLTRLLALAALCGAAGSTKAQTITAAMAAPAGSVDLTKPGFNLRTVHIGNTRLNPVNVATAEQVLSSLAIDPTTNLPFVNNATPNDVDGTFWWTVEGYINTHEQAANGATGGNFSTAAAAPHDKADEPIAGIPGLAGTTGDYFVQEYTGFMQIPTTANWRFGVNSDDGFRLTIGQGLDFYAIPGTTIPGPGLQLTVLDGTRGFGNTEVTINNIPAGLYPFRLIWWESAGANSGVEFYTFGAGQTGGNRYLVNDVAAGNNSIKTFRSAVTAPAYYIGRYPAPGATGVEAYPYIRTIVKDGASPVLTALDKAIVRIDGNDATVNKSVVKNGAETTIQAQPAAPLDPNTQHTAMVIVETEAGTKFTNAWTFTISNYPTVPVEWAIPSVDTTKPGFRVKVNQLGRNTGGVIELLHRAPQTFQSYAAERQLFQGFNDPATGEKFPNLANLVGPVIDPGTMLPWPGSETAPAADADGYFIDQDVINYAENTGSQGNFPNDERTPGISFLDETGATVGNPNPADGAAIPADSYVVSFETILDLKAGTYRFGINSDDGCRLTVGHGPGDVTGSQILVANVDRGPADSQGDVKILADGFYSFRGIYWETGGGSEGEFFVVNQQTLERTLINAESGNIVIKAYRESATMPPTVTKVVPVVNEQYVFADQNIVMDITEGALAVDEASIEFRLNNNVQTITKAKTGKVTKVTRESSVTNLLPSGNNTARLTYTYTPTGGAAISVTNQWNFFVPIYTRVIPAGNRVQESEVSGSGFHIAKVVQIDRHGNNNQGDGGRYVGNAGNGNAMPRPEIELAMGYLRLDGTPYPNLASEEGVPGDVEYLNFNWTTTGTGNSGLMNGDQRGPGLPGTGTSNAGLDNSVHEIFTYLNLKKGAHVLGINVDDGFTFTSSPNAKDTLGTLVAFKNAPGGNNGAPLHNSNVAFNLIVPEDGIYPFRLLFWQGGGGVNIEAVKLDRDTGILSLINDVSNVGVPTHPTGGTGIIRPPFTLMTSFSTYNGPVRPWTKFSVYPMRNDATLWQNYHQQSGAGPITVRVGSGNPADIANDVAAIRPYGDSVGAIVADLGTGTVDMVIDGQDVTPTVTDIPNSTDKLVTYVPDPPFVGGTTHTAGLVYAGTTNYWTFTVIDVAAVPAGSKANGSGDPAKRGFKVKMAQRTSGRPGGNTVLAAETQLADINGNVAIPGPEGGSYIADLINYNDRKNTGGNNGADIGLFSASRGSAPDVGFPGIPGTGTTSRDNFTMEATAWLELKKGYQKFAVNGDDGWAVTVAEAGKTDGQVLFAVDRGTGARIIPFAFTVPADGLYPIRLVHYEGGGDGNVEFFTYGEANTPILVNDPNNPAAVKAYYGLTGGGGTDPEITFTFSGSTLTINWTGGGQLESTTSLTPPITWQGTGNSTGQAIVNVPAGAGTVYYRINRP